MKLDQHTREKVLYWTCWLVTAGPAISLIVTDLYERNATNMATTSCACAVLDGGGSSHNV